MKLKIKSIKKALTKNYLRQHIHENDYDLFITSFNKYIHNIKDSKIEDNLVKNIENFFTETFYSKYYGEKKSYKGLNAADFVIHLDNNTKSNVGILFEIKTENSNDMIDTGNLNKKAFHQIISYYLYEKIEYNNHEIKHLIISNSIDFYIFDAKDFNDLFYTNNDFKKLFISWKNGNMDNSTTEFLYNRIKELIDNIDDDISCIHFNLIDNEIKMNLTFLYKIMDPKYLLKITNIKDSNELNKDFYYELLYIIGLEEIKENGKETIKRKIIPDEGSVLENVITIIDNEGHFDRIKNIDNYGDKKGDQLFNIALELSITWINRIIFLKLLESQLLTYHKGDKKYFFLSSSKILTYGDLNHIFFSILSVPYDKRSNTDKEKYGHLPYLNSSLFEISILEKDIFNISNLNSNLELLINKKSVLFKKFGNNLKNKTINTIKYLLDFLDSYDFGTDYNDNDSIIDKNKSLINSSVLGLIFEKINGYKEGSYYTPSFITMNICKELILKLFINKFSEKYNKKFENIKSLKNFINKNKYNTSDLIEANNIINSIKICDPAVGSGHFLVSALNELLYLKSYLGLLLYKDNELINEYDIEVENDELVIKDITGNIYEYHVEVNNKPNPKLQKLQESIFKEKQNIIENCLFGVDINYNSVNICRLRLWIELLKSSYYIEGNNFLELQTLPNIDINIKQGNSLISKFGLDIKLNKIKDNKFIKDYSKYVKEYKKTNDKTIKESLKNMILESKDKIKIELSNIKKFKNLIDSTSETLEFDDSDKINKQNLIKEYNEEIKIIEDKNKKLFKDSFEWRFEFPEILDEKGDFIGFDIIIGNPPYIGEKQQSLTFEILKQIEKWKQFYRKRTNIYYFFIRQGLDLLKENGFISYIVPNEFLTADYANKLRQFIINNSIIISIYDFNKNKVFEDVGTTSLIFILKKLFSDNYNFIYRRLLDNEKVNTIFNDNKCFENKEINISELKINKDSFWTFMQNEINISSNKMIDIKTLFGVSQGIVTGSDKVTNEHFRLKEIDKKYIECGIFVLTENKDIKIENNNIYLYFSDNKEWKKITDHEKQYIKPFISSIHLNKWNIMKNQDWIIYFKGNLISSGVIYEYLKQFKKILINRSKIIDNIIEIEDYDNYTKNEIKLFYSPAGAVQKVMNKKWFLPFYERVDVPFDSVKIIVNSKKASSFTYSEFPCYSSGGGLGGQNFIFPNYTFDIEYYNLIKKYSNINDFMKYINCILNSNKIKLFIESSKYNQLSSDKIKNLPIYKIDFINDDDKKFYFELINKANQLIKLNTDNNNYKIIESEIDQIINKLF